MSALAAPSQAGRCEEPKATKQPRTTFLLGCFASLAMTLPACEAKASGGARRDP